MKYKYRNLKHVILHGMEPYGTGEFDHLIEGGGIELISEQKTPRKAEGKREKNKHEGDKE